MTPRLREKYKNEIIKNLMAKLSLNNIHAVPRIDKIVINMGLGAEALEKKKLETCIKDIAAIAGLFILFKVPSNILDININAPVLPNESTASVSFSWVDLIARYILECTFDFITSDGLSSIAMLSEQSIISDADRSFLNFFKYLSIDSLLPNK